MKRTIALIAAAATLGGGLVACSNDEANTASDPDAGVVTEDKGAANATPHEADENVHASDASETVSEGDDPATDGAQGETVEQQTADGNTTLIPADLKVAIEEQESEWGLPELIQQEGDKALAQFADGNYLAWSEETGAVPVIGKIAETWTVEGGLNSELGMPTAPEKELDGEQGWTQSFTNGVMQWVNDNGEWGAKTEPRP